MSGTSPVTDAQLNAFIDGQLPPRVEHAITLALEKDPVAAARAAMWRRQSGALKAAFAPIAEEPLPLSLILKVRASLPNRPIARIALIGASTFVAGLIVGAALTLVLLQAS
jgi:anti-sigma factor RsiW